MNALVTQTRKTLFARVVFNLCEMKRSEKEKGKIFSFLLMKRQKERNMYEEKKKDKKDAFFNACEKGKEREAFLHRYFGAFFSACPVSEFRKASGYPTDADRGFMRYTFFGGIPPSQVVLIGTLPICWHFSLESTHLCFGKL